MARARPLAPAVRRSGAPLPGEGRPARAPAGSDLDGTGLRAVDEPASTQGGDDAAYEPGHVGRDGTGQDDEAVRGARLQPLLHGRHDVTDGADRLERTRSEERRVGKEGTAPRP